MGRTLSDEHESTARAAARDVPVIAVITAITAACGLVQLFHPALVTSWRRDTDGLQAGEWWRLLTPMLVQGDGLFQYAFNLAGSALVGPSVERRYGHRAVLVVYLAGGVSGIGLEYLVHPRLLGSGSSDAVAALVGALWWMVVARGRPVTAPTAIYAAYFPVSLLALRIGGPVGSTVAGAVLAAGMSMLLRRDGPPALSRLMIVVVPIPALLLLVLLDSHGLGLALGALVGMVLRHPGHERRRRELRSPGAPADTDPGPPSV
jgi:membrane associated rhomboid family serine protease